MIQTVGSFYNSKIPEGERETFGARRANFNRSAAATNGFKRRAGNLEAYDRSKSRSKKNREDRK